MKIMTLKSNFSKITKAIQKLNLVKAIDKMEQDQGVADMLEDINKEILEEQKRKSICRKAKESCFLAIQEHLSDFLKQHPYGTYEEWITDLHPDNVRESASDDGIDHRFYVEESDHRILWNETILNTINNSDKPVDDAYIFKRLGAIVYPRDEKYKAQ